MNEKRVDILTEITPGANKSNFYIVDRYKEAFDFPVHRHTEYEMNFLSGCRGARRIVGDSVEELGDFDLVFVASDLQHGWEQHNCRSTEIHEITVQMPPEFLNVEYFRKFGVTKMVSLFDASRFGVTFGTETIMKAFTMLNRILNEPNSFDRFQMFFMLINRLAETGDYRRLSSSTFSNADDISDSRRVNRVMEYIGRHYPERIRLNDLAAIAGMTESAFSRFFKQRAGQTVSDYIIDIRLGAAARLLTESTQTVSEICYGSGFSNVSHFSRCFKSKRGCTPTEFRTLYSKTKKAPGQ
ncbi:MAG: AraC family transcriptional regulator [Muribaculaceae bacterium]|nr:AraC family transcriptional regulator [Muribaculaceae bacterium]